LGLKGLHGGYFGGVFRWLLVAHGGCFGAAWWLFLEVNGGCLV